MKARVFTLALVMSAACLFCLLGTGCNPPGKPMQQVESRPDQLADFDALYTQNCAACHGEHGKGGAAISLANPVYLATAGTDTIKRITAAGVSGTAMPPFGRAAGGLLTDRQITILAEGMERVWGSPQADLLPYTATAAGDHGRGRAAYAAYCARCHGADGTGMSAMHTGSIVDPSYLALVSDQGLRSTIIAGLPDQGMPDWRSDAIGPNSRAMSEQEVTDVVAWIASHRVAAPGQPYQQP
jgi:cytochrome c oxidase cbb3-type subunit 3/ubiquinol-cytochrome c reductase cytochrome c subunit